MKTPKLYTCVGYSFADNNGHLLRSVGEAHTISDWLKKAFPGQDAEAYFDGRSDSFIVSYLFDNMRIRLEKKK